MHRGGFASGRWEIMIGLREILLIGMVVLVLYGRSGVLKSQRAQTILPWLSPRRRGPTRKRSSREVPPVSSVAAARSRIRGASLLRGNRLFWFLTVLTATAVGAWIVTRTLIASGHSVVAGP
jgi:hypothetical protein